MKVSDKYQDQILRIKQESTEDTIVVEKLDSREAYKQSGVSMQEGLLDQDFLFSKCTVFGDLNKNQQEQPKEMEVSPVTPIKARLMKDTKVRYLALTLAVLLLFGNNYSFDNPQALQKPIMQDIDVTNPQYNLLYSVFSFPNIFLTLAGGYLIDKLGSRIGIFIFTFSVTLSTFVVAIGGTYKKFWVMLLGRGIFGASSENLIIAQSAMVTKWFKGKDLSFAIGVIMTIPELASAINSFISPMIYDMTQQLSYPLFTSVIICFLSFLFGLALIFLDRKADKQLEGLKLICSLNISFLLEINGVADIEEAEEPVSFRDIKDLNATFWILLLVCMLTLGVYVPFLDDANDFIQEKFKFNPVVAGRLLVIPYILSAIFSPLLGTYVDNIGNRRLFICLTCILFTASHLLFGLLETGTENEPNWLVIIPLSLMGISYAFYSCVLIPSVQYVVPQRIMGTAFGLMGMLESVALAIFPLIAANIVTASQSDEEGYSRVGLFYAGMAGLGLIMALSLYCFDRKGSKILDFVNPDKPTEQEKFLLKPSRRIIEEEEEESSSDEDLTSDQEDEQQFEEENQLDVQTLPLSDQQIHEIQVSLVRRTQSDYLTKNKSLNMLFDT